MERLGPVEEEALRRWRARKPLRTARADARQHALAVNCDHRVDPRDRKPARW
jgi:hypothetical protein